MLAGALCVEAFCRVAGPAAAFDAFKTRNWPNPEIFQPSSILPYELAPNLPHLSNSLGMRDKERVIEKPRGVFRVVFLGDSITMYGHFTDLLEDWLNRQWPGRFQIWNCAIGGQGIREYAIMMERRVPLYKPDLVVVSFCLNDLDLTPVMYYDTRGRLNCYKPLPGIPSTLEIWLYKHSHAYRRGLLYVTTRFPQTLQPGSVEMGEKALDVIQRSAARMGIPVRAVVFPWLKPEASWDPYERAAYVNITGLLKRRGIAYLDLARTFPSDQRIGLRRWPADDVHPNDAGDTLAARAIHRFLRTQGFLPAQARTFGGWKAP